jgi:hypothetical protein
VCSLSLSTQILEEKEDFKQLEDFNRKDNNKGKKGATPEISNKAFDDDDE